MKNKKKEFVKEMKELEVILNENKVDNKTIADLFGTSYFEGSIFEQVHKVIGLLINSIAKNYNIHRDCIDWLIYENDFGKKKLSCRLENSKDDVIIDSIEKFYDFEMISNDN